MPRQEAKEMLGTLDFRVLPVRMDGPVRAVWWETRVLTEDEEPRVRREVQVSLEQQDSRELQELLVLRVPEGSEVNLDPEASSACLDLREARDQPEVTVWWDGAAGTDRRDNQENLEIKEQPEGWDPEELRVRTAEMVMDPQELLVQRVILVFLAILVFRARTACRDPEESLAAAGTEAEGETLDSPESRECRESTDIQDTKVPEVLLEAKP